MAIRFYFTGHRGLSIYVLTVMNLSVQLGIIKVWDLLNFDISGIWQVNRFFISACFPSCLGHTRFRFLA